MNDRREILFLAHRIPYPPDKGDKIRSWRLVEHLAKSWRVHLAAFVDDPANFVHEDFLETVCESVHLVRLRPFEARLKSAAGFLTGEPLTFPYYRHAEMIRHVKALRARDLAFEFAFSSSMAPYLEKSHEGRPRFIDLCDADSEKWRAYGKARAGLMAGVYTREADSLAKAEARILNWADAAFAVSDAEASIFNSHADVLRKALVLPNGVDANYFSPAGLEGEKGAAEVVFIGAMDYAPNVDAALWFAGEVWPLVRARAPEARFAIIGPRPSREILGLESAGGVRVTGRVADVRPWLAAARVVIAPLRIARGVQNKVLEAMAMGRPVVATSTANAGIEARRDEEILIADEAAAFAAEVAGLLADPQRGGKLGAAARARVIADFGWPAQFGKLDAAIASVLSR